MIEFGTVTSALTPPRRVWVDRGTPRRCGNIGNDMPDDVKQAAREQQVRF